VNFQTWAILASWGAVAVAGAGVQAARWFRRRRQDRAWAEGVARNLRDRLYLEDLERDFASEEKTK